MYQDAVSKATSHACLSDASALFCRLTSPHTQTHAHANLSVSAPRIPSECASLGLEGRGGASGGGERETGRCEREQGSFSLVHSLHLPSFPPFLELSKESVSRITAPVILCPTVPLCMCVCVCVCACVCVCNIYINIYL